MQTQLATLNSWRGGAHLPLVAFRNGVEQIITPCTFSATLPNAGECTRLQVINAAAALFP